MNGIGVGFVKNILSLFYPLHCDGCRKPLHPLSGNTVCDDCRARITPNPQPYCKKCGRSVRADTPLCDECLKECFHFSHAYSACIYENGLKDLIRMFKYRGKMRLAGVFIAIMAEFIKKNRVILDGVDMISFVPANKSSFNARGFNQSEILAAGISKIFEIPLFDTLSKNRRTRRQSELSRDERLRNLKDAFEAKASPAVRGLRVLLIDDVMTTGATLNECARVLRESGAAEVSCLTLARGS